jgi:hypothetical protein
MRIVVIASLVGASAAGAQPTMYAIDGARDTLITIDLATAATRDVGPLGFDGGFWGIAFSPMPLAAPGGGVFPAGTLFGVERSTQRLYSIDTATGHATPIGPLNILGVWEALTFDALGRLWTTDVYDKFTIDTATGQATHAPGGFGAPGGLAYALDTLPVPVPALGGTLPAGTIIGCSNGSFFAMDGLSWGPLLAAMIPEAQEVIVAAPDGTLYAIGGPLGDLWLWKVSLDPVGAEPIGALGSGAIWGGAIIPAPGTAALIGGAMFPFRRRRPSAA